MIVHAVYMVLYMKFYASIVTPVLVRMGAPLWVFEHYLCLVNSGCPSYVVKFFAKHWDDIPVHILLVTSHTLEKKKT